MSWIALKMLTGDRGKYFAIVFGITFASLLITEQSGIFCGVMLRTTSQIRDIEGVDVWVMNPNVRYFDDLKAISDDDLYRVRGVSGVDWAVSLYRGSGQAQLSNGNYQGLILIGIDDATLAGAPRRCLSENWGICKSPIPSLSMKRASVRCGPASL